MLQTTINKIKSLKPNQILIGNTVYEAKICIMNGNHNAIQVACCSLISLIYNKQCAIRGETKFHKPEIVFITEAERDNMIAAQKKNPNDTYPIMIDCGVGFLNTAYVLPQTKRAYSKDKKSITNVPFSALGTLWRNTYKMFDISHQFMYVLDYNFIIPIERYFYMHIPDPVASTINMLCCQSSTTADGFDQAFKISSVFIQTQIDATLAIQEYYGTYIVNKLSIFDKIKKVKTETVPPLILERNEVPTNMDLIRFCIPYRWNMDTPCEPGQYMFNGVLYEQDNGTWRWQRIYYLPDNSADFCNSQYSYRSVMTLRNSDKKVKKMGVLSIGGNIADVEWVIFDTKDHAINFIDYLSSWKYIVCKSDVK